MKMENKRLAQEKRAKERERRERVKQRKKLLMIFGPVGVLFLLIVWIAIYAIQDISVKGEKDADTVVNADYDNTDSMDEDEDMVLSTDTKASIEDGDTVNIDYVGYVGDKAFEGGDTQGNGTDLTIGSGTYIDGFEDQLIGHHVGDEFDVIVTFPDDYGNDELNGKEAVFKVVINGIYE